MTINPALDKDSVLYKIVADKLTEVEERKSEPVYDFADGVDKSDRDFYSHLQSKVDINEPLFILECKKASPSKGLIREDFDVAEIVSIYKNYATAISVLTDEKYFQGSFDYIKIAKDNSTQPILCKDFFIDEYQIYLARFHGANAILLMLSVLDDETYTALAETAHSLGMGVLTEVSNEIECKRAGQLGAKVIGINNRNLRDLSTDLNRTGELRKLLPDNAIIISESGIYTFNDNIKLRPDSNGFLIGSSIMAQSDIDMAIRKIVYGENKVCGLKSPEIAKTVYENGGVYGGLIFVEKSKRYVDMDTAKTIIDSVPLNYVGVFQNHDIDDVITTAKSLNLYGVQLHGDETNDYINKIKTALPNIKIFKALGIDTESSAFPDINDFTAVDFFVIDSVSNGQSGGTGKVFNWDIIPTEIKNKSLLSGGIGIDNISGAINQNCLGLDMNSKLENESGDKQPELIKTAFKTIKTNG